MEKAISAADANRNFSQLLHGVRKGHSYIVTSHGKPVAKIVPMAERDKIAAGTRSMLLARLRSQRVVDAGRWTRDELYEDAE
jgi:prevent-host-death family protein